jgi:2-desacetyl-2-hydroxyethyl bacteriochlorophyllide A dehydrogenase
MKALTYNFSNRKFTYKGVDLPKMKADELLIKIKSSALCGTDLHIMKGPLSEKRYANEIIMGHSFSGKVEKTGKLVKKFKPGDRIFASDFVWCGKCQNCLNGKQNLCDNRYIFGMETAGSHAEFLNVPARACFLLPREIDFDQGSLICDLLAIVHHAIKRASLSGNERILIFGVGPLGIGLGLLLKEFGFKEIVFIDTQKERRAWAEQILKQKISQMKDLKDSDFFDVAFDASGSKIALELGFKGLRRGGKLIIIGVQNEPFVLNSIKMISRELSVFGSYEFNISDVKESLRLVKSGKINLGKIITHHFILKDGAKAYKLLKARTSGKIILSL